MNMMTMMNHHCHDIHLGMKKHCWFTFTHNDVTLDHSSNWQIVSMMIMMTMVKYISQINDIPLGHNSTYWVPIQFISFFIPRWWCWWRYDWLWSHDIKLIPETQKAGWHQRGGCRLLKQMCALHKSVNHQHVNSWLQLLRSAVHVWLLQCQSR